MAGPEPAATAPGPAPKRALLVATAAEAAGAGLVVAGLTVVDRAHKQLQRMGYTPTVASDGACALPKGVSDLQPLDESGAETAAPPSPATPETTAARKAALENLARELGSPPRVAADVVRPGNRDVAGGVRVVDEPSRLRAEDAIFAELLRGDLGFVARHCNKPLSFRFTRHVLCKLPVTPNQVTIGAAIVGLLGAFAIATGQYGWTLFGFVLAHLQSVLDGCDGELARVRFQQSAIGEWLDTVVDDGLNLALFIAIGVGLWHKSGATRDLVLGLVTAAMMLTYNAVAYRELVRQGEGGEVLKVRWWFAGGGNLKDRYGDQHGPFAALLSIGRRDFFLLAWVVFALFGWMRFILLYAAILALVNFVVAVGQIVLGPPATSRTSG